MNIYTMLAALSNFVLVQVVEVDKVAQGRGRTKTTTRACAFPAS